MNIFEREAKDIRDYLERHGYTARQGPDHIIVQDPVLFMSGGKTSRQYKDVMIRDWPAAIHFVEKDRDQDLNRNPAHLRRP